MNRIRNWLTELGVLTSRPAAFVIFVLYGLVWLTVGEIDCTALQRLPPGARRS
jgi:hypothetical protein